MYFSYITRLFFGSKPQQVFPDVSKYDIYPKWVQKKDEKKRKKGKKRERKRLHRVVHKHNYNYDPEE